MILVFVAISYSLCRPCQSHVFCISLVYLCALSNLEYLSEVQITPIYCNDNV